jgi:hypothetical protein
MRRQAAEVMMGRQMVRRRRRRRLLRDGVTGEAYGKRSRDGEGLDHGACLPPSLRSLLCHTRVEGLQPPIRVRVQACRVPSSPVRRVEAGGCHLRLDGFRMAARNS